MPIVLEAVPPILVLAGFVVMLGLAYTAKIWVGALFQVADSAVGWIPWVGRKASNGVRAVEQRVNHRLTEAVVKLEGAVTSTWHVLAAIVEQTGAAIWEATRLAADAWWKMSVTYPLEVLDALARAAQAGAHKIGKVSTTIVRQTYVTRGVAKAELDALARKVRALDRRVAAIAVAGAGAIARPFPRIGSLERSLEGLRGRVGRLEHRFSRKAFVAAVATALGVLGLSWARRTCARRNNELLCRTDFDMLEGLLGGLILILSSVSLLSLARGMQEVTDEVTGAVRAFLREASALDDGNAPPRMVFGIEGNGAPVELGFGVQTGATRFGIEA